MADEGEQIYGLLSGSDLIKHYSESHEVQAQFNRLVSVEELDEQRRDDLERMKEQFRRLLSQERVSKIESISEGVWEAEQHRIRLTRVEGKRQPFGYEDSTGKYLDCHEALFLMEMNRLLVKWNGAVISIEQGYSLFLGRPNSLLLEEYVVYSILNRASYYVLRCDSGRKYQTPETGPLSDEERYVWGNLYEMLNQPNPRESEQPKKDVKLYESVKRSMLNYNKLIRNPPVKHRQGLTSTQCDEDPIEPPSKKPKSEDAELSGGSDCFRRIEQFRRMFDQFDLVRSVTEEDQPAAMEEGEERLELVFDLFASDSQMFKKSLPPLPIARILVRRSSQAMPSFIGLQRVYREQKDPVPLMLMLVSDSLTVHCFLYDMRRISRNIITLPNDSAWSNR